MKQVLVTGAAGFIGYHVVKRLLEAGFRVTGIDNLNAYYEVQLKLDRLAQLGIDPEKGILDCDRFRYQTTELEDKEAILHLMQQHSFEYIIHLAAQAGVRYSLEHPQTYVHSNVTGFLNILEGARTFKPKHVIFASSSSVYGLNTVYPFSENDSTDHPISLYAATKKANEMMAHTYAHLFEIPLSGLRFFTVYGSWGRPEMAPMLFAKNILEGKPIAVFNHGDMYRDFTFVEDIAESIFRLLEVIPQKSALNTDKLPSSESTAPYKIYNIGNNNPVKLMDFIDELEAALGVNAIRDFQPIQPGDVVKTYADSSALYHAIGYKPQTTLRDGIKSFADWYKSYR